MGETKTGKRGNPNWVKGGASPNPSGRPGIAPDIKKAIDEMTLPAIVRLAELIESTDEKVAIAAIKEALDRGLGKALQNLALSGDGEGAPLGFRVRFDRDK